MRGFLIVVPLAVVLAIAPQASPASAHQSPAGCAGSGLRVDFSPDSGLATIHRNGDHLEIGARVRNDWIADPCDLSDLEVAVVLPAPDGGAGRRVVLATGRDLPAGAAQATLPATAPYDVDLDEGVFNAPVTVTYEARVHLGAGDPSTGQSSLSAPIGISRPRTELTVIPDVSAGPPPLSVTYTYSLTNTSPVLPGPMLPTPALFSGAADDKALVKDGNCAPVAYTGGDDGLTTPALLDPLIEPATPAETWTFTCKRTFDAPGTFVSSAEVSGVSQRDGRPWPASPATSDVTVLGSDLAVSKTHKGDLIAGGSGDYRIEASNSGNQPTVGTVTVADLLPAGLTATDISGEGWACGLEALSCTRADPLASGGTYPPVILKVEVSPTAAGMVTNRAVVSGGGQPDGATANDSSDDPTVIRAPGKPAPPASAKRFRIRSVKTKPNGRVVVRVTAPAAGRIRIDDAARRPNLVVRASRKLRKRGTYNVAVKANRGFKRRLRRAHRARRVALEATFRASGGTTATRRVKARFRVG